MTLRELINQVTGNQALGDYLRNFKELDKELIIVDFEDKMKIDNVSVEKEDIIINISME